VGNQREILQREPSQNQGVILRVLPTESERVRDLLKDKKSFYTHFVPAGQVVSFPNLDGPDTVAEKDIVDTVVIQSGGKMWCGYEQFVDLISRIASSVEDALFYVGDEQDYIDEFRIRNRCLQYSRVHQGYWWPLQDFLASTPTAGGDT
jgi:hypothetical protein